jgi:hypothetical protein
MSYWPVIVKRAHLKDMREYISSYHQKPFDQAFHENISDVYQYSQFGIMCTYLFTFKRDEYKWYVHTETPNWDGIDPPPNRGQNGNLSIFSLDMYYPKPRVATHARYRGRHESNILRWPEAMNQLYQQGYCLSPPLIKPNPAHAIMCNSSSTTNQTREQGYFEEQFRFGKAITGD